MAPNKKQPDTGKLDEVVAASRRARDQRQEIRPSRFATEFLKGFSSQHVQCLFYAWQKQIHVRQR